MSQYDPVEELKRGLDPADLREFLRLGGTDKRLRFVWEILQTGDVKEAYIKAGYTPKSAEKNAWGDQGAQHPSVQFLLARLSPNKLLAPAMILAERALMLGATSKDIQDMKAAFDIARPFVLPAIEEASRKAQASRKLLDRLEEQKKAGNKPRSEEIREFFAGMTAEERREWLAILSDVTEKEVPPQ